MYEILGSVQHRRNLMQGNRKSLFFLIFAPEGRGPEAEAVGGIFDCGAYARFLRIEIRVFSFVVVVSH